MTGKEACVQVLHNRRHQADLLTAATSKCQCCFVQVSLMSTLKLVSIRNSPNLSMLLWKALRNQVSKHIFFQGGIYVLLVFIR